MSQSDMIDDDKKSRWSLPKWGWFLVVTSLALNLLVIGSMIGMFLSGGHHGKGGPGMRGIVRSLPADQRTEVRQILRKHRETVRPLRRALRDERRDLVAYARSDDFELAEFERRIAALGEKRASIHKKLEPMVVELGRILEPEMRARMLARLLRGDRRRGHRRHRRYRD